MSSNKTGFSSEGKMRIGYLSSDFRNHSVAYFFQPIIEHYNRDQFEVFCFSNSDIEDETTQFIREHSDRFIPISNLSDSIVLNQIKSFNLHGLVEVI